MKGFPKALVDTWTVFQYAGVNHFSQIFKNCLQQLLETHLLGYLRRSETLP
jgi:hypothetical protein